MRYPIVVIPCSKGKVEAAHVPAEFLYTGAMFRMSLRAADALTAPYRVLIMSAKHGLLRAHHRVSTYECTIDSPEAISLEDLRYHYPWLEQNTMQKISPWVAPRVVSLLPNQYHQLFVDTLGDRCNEPVIHVFAGCRGIGDQRHRLRDIIENGRSAIPELQDTGSVAETITHSGVAS